MTNLHSPHLPQSIIGSTSSGSDSKSISSSLIGSASPSEWNSSSSTSLTWASLALLRSLVTSSSAHDSSINFHVSPTTGSLSKSSSPPSISHPWACVDSVCRRGSNILLLFAFCLLPFILLLYWTKRSWLRRSQVSRFLFFVWFYNTECQFRFSINQIWNTQTHLENIGKLTPSRQLQFLSQPEELEVKTRILVAILCNAGTCVP